MMIKKVMTNFKPECYDALFRFPHYKLDGDPICQGELSFFSEDDNIVQPLNPVFSQLPTYHVRTVYITGIEEVEILISRWREVFDFCLKKHYQKIIIDLDSLFEHTLFSNTQHLDCLFSAFYPSTAIQLSLWVKDKKKRLEVEGVLNLFSDKLDSSILYDIYKNLPNNIKVIDGQTFHRIIQVQKIVDGKTVVWLPYRPQSNRLIDERGIEFTISSPAFIKFQQDIPEWYLTTGHYLLVDNTKLVGAYFREL